MRLAVLARDEDEHLTEAGTTVRKHLARVDDGPPLPRVERFTEYIAGERVDPEPVAGVGGECTAATARPRISGDQWRGEDPRQGASEKRPRGWR